MSSLSMQEREMSFRRRSSLGQNQTADQARIRLEEAFESADTDKSGYVDKEELELVLREQLLINLSDPEEDMQIIFSLLDRDDSGLISVKEFRAAFEPGIAKRSLTQTGTMDVDDLMKDTFQAFISESRHERGIVIRAFMEAHNEIEESGRGFGKNYWSPACSP